MVIFTFYLQVTLLTVNSCQNVEKGKEHRSHCQQTKYSTEFSPSSYFKCFSIFSLFLFHFTDLSNNKMSLCPSTANIKWCHSRLKQTKEVLKMTNYIISEIETLDSVCSALSYYFAIHFCIGQDFLKVKILIDFKQASFLLFLSFLNLCNFFQCL